MTVVGVRSLDEVLTERFSCRAFTAEVVATSTVEEVLQLAQRTPSWCNTQSWQVHLVAGAAVPRLSAALRQHATASGEFADLGLPGEYTGVYQQRRRETGFALYRSVGVARDDRPGRAEQAARNLSFFGAPHLFVITGDRDHGGYGVLDCGAYVATLLLVLESRGIAAVAQGAVAMYSDAVRAFLELPDDRVVVCAVSFGHADESHPANGFRTDRAALNEVLHVLDR